MIYRRDCSLCEWRVVLFVLRVLGIPHDAGVDPWSDDTDYAALIVEGAARAWVQNYDGSRLDEHGAWIALVKLFASGPKRRRMHTLWKHCQDLLNLPEVELPHDWRAGADRTRATRAARAARAARAYRDACGARALKRDLALPGLPRRTSGLASACLDIPDDIPVATEGPCTDRVDDDALDLEDDDAADRVYGGLAPLGTVQFHRISHAFDHSGCAELLGSDTFPIELC